MNGTDQGQPGPADSPRRSRGLDRRGVLKLLPWVSGGFLLAAYGSLAAFFSRFLFPARARRGDWLFVQSVSEVEPGASFSYELPDGRPVSISRQGAVGTAADFVALSSTCPHLGCRVHWEPRNERFFCPCHNGVFDAGGRAIAGPPADAGQSLPTYPLRVDRGLLYIEAPASELAAAPAPPRRCREKSA